MVALYLASSSPKSGVHKLMGSRGLKSLPQSVLLPRIMSQKGKRIALTRHDRNSGVNDARIGGRLHDVEKRSSQCPTEGFDPKPECDQGPLEDAFQN